MASTGTSAALEAASHMQRGLASRKLRKEEEEQQTATEGVILFLDNARRDKSLFIEPPMH